MFSHNLLTIFRSFRREKVTFLINLTGLSCSLAVALMIYLWVSDEFAFDRFYDDHERIYQVMENKVEAGTIHTTTNTPDFLADALLKEMPEVEFAAAATPPDFFPAFELSDGVRHVKAIGKFAEPGFLRVFGISTDGGQGNALADKNAIIITKSLARSLFGNPEAGIGKSLEWKVMGISRNVMVTGVMEDFPANASERFDFLASFDSFREIMGMQNTAANWDSTAPFVTYVKISENASAESLKVKMETLLSTKTKNSPNRTLFITQYADKYLRGQYENGMETGGRIDYVILFTCIASFIVLIACINFTNLATARALSRAKGSGIRKAIGAQRINLVFLYFSEAMVITLTSIVMASLIAKLLLPQFNSITGKHLELVLNWQLVIGLIAIFIVTSVMAGAYPALYLSGFSPARVLKGQLNVSGNGAIARKGLVVFQFVMSMVLVAGVIVVQQQIEFISTKDLGFNKEHVIAFEADGAVAEKVESFLSEVRNIPGVVGASGMMGVILSNGDLGSDGEVKWEDKVIRLPNITVNYDFLELLDIELKEGRSFSRAHNTDADKIILNEAAVDALSLADPVGKNINGKEVLGVVKNFHFQSMRDAVKPLAIRLEPAATTTILIRYQPNNEQATLDRLATFFKIFNPGYAFNYHYLDADFRAQYASENRVGVLSRYAAGLTIIISCLGLLGLVIFTTETRRKEISIRKILGSGELNIVVLLSGGFMKTVLAAVIVAMPLSYLLSRTWLDSFAYKIDLQYWYFIVAALCIVGIAFLTVAIQTWKAALLNPIKNLKAE